MMIVVGVADTSLAFTWGYMLCIHHIILFHMPRYLEMWEPLWFPFTEEEIKALRSMPESGAGTVGF